MPKFDDIASMTSLEREIYSTNESVNLLLEILKGVYVETPENLYKHIKKKHEAIAFLGVKAIDCTKESVSEAKFEMLE